VIERLRRVVRLQRLLLVIGSLLGKRARSRFPFGAVCIGGLGPLAMPRRDHRWRGLLTGQRVIGTKNGSQIVEVAGYAAV
jgi:hypothetical protein